MQFIKNELMQNETIQYSCKPHWIIYAPAVAWLIFAAIVYFLGADHTIGRFRIDNYPPVYLIIASISLIIGIYHLLQEWVTHIFTNYVITNHRVIIRQGLIFRKTNEIILQKIEGVDAVVSILGRILKYGTIIITGVGGSRDTFPNLPNPYLFRKLVQTKIEELLSGHVEQNK